MQTRWFAHVARRNRARLRLFCLPHAGASAAIYREWAAQLPDDVEIWPVQLPGRGARLAEPAFEDTGSAVAALAEVLQPHLDLPFALFGHSMGATLSFELSRTLRDMYGLLAAHLFVSARHAPAARAPTPPIHTLDDRRFLAAVAAYGGMHAEILASEEMLRLVLPSLRADFKLAETYVYRGPARLDTPITVLYGKRDFSLPEALTAGWRLETRARCTRHANEGDHFFVVSHRQEVLRRVCAEIRSH